MGDAAFLSCFRSAIISTESEPRSLSASVASPRSASARLFLHFFALSTILKHPKKQRQGLRGNFAPPLRSLPMLARALRTCESPSHPRAHSGEGAHRVRHSSCLRAMRLSCRTLVCAATVDLFLSVKVCVAQQLLKMHDLNPLKIVSRA